MSISDYLENKVLDKVHSNTDFTVTSVYVSLHTGDPGEDGANECTGEGYIRKAITFTTAASGAVANSGNIVFTSMPACTVSFVGEWDAETVGNFLWGGALDASQVVNLNNTFTISSGDLDVVLD